MTDLVPRSAAVPEVRVGDRLVYVLEETWTARALRDSRLASTGGGADEVMLQVLAKIDGFQ